ncbi:DUF1571 domain-containing protein [Burkholderia stagnalis]|uniref:DUF1571 domain-containing protein n=1 Tax=Burkholderia stagnalis TaxID=1503054 RepID=UPI00075EA6BD|nr:DUF1571 domain-containing protein [Burkholderia stagnalis]KVO59568.1 hypothetical protein WT18_13545 [Burkholderia stagnalis]KVP11735.1 hypothetical protein WT20_13770 [Burkholderia stagnalis]KVW88851.1 hypothetical protein WT30_31755 [Burkholderia stagnalis]KWH70679.1 hypothetical protein WT66_27965 [Burkholderia stagnalis]
MTRSTGRHARPLRRHAAVATLVAALVLALPGVRAQEAAGTAPATHDAAARPADLANVTRQPAAQQARWLRAAARQGTLAKLDDATLAALFAALDPLAVPEYIRQGPNGYPSYQFTMVRQERINGKWSDTPDRMLVRTTREPLRVYAKWLPDGAHAGQEIIYDTTRRKDEMVGHLGGLLGKLPMWTALDGTLARAQSNHQVKDLGTEFIANLYLTEGRKYLEAGVQRPTRVEAKTVGGVRVVALTYETPTGRPQFYAKKEILGLDLREPYFRTVESYDNDGRVFERIVIEKIAPASFDDAAFDPKNPDYAF